MSEENLELVRAGFAAHNRGDLDALTQFYDENVVFKTLLLGTHRGNEAIRLIYEENQKTLSGYDVVPVELIDAGDQVVAVAQVSGAGSSSEIAMEDRDRFAFLFTIKDGRCVRERRCATGPKPSKRPDCRSRRSGASRTRTGDLLGAIQALFQLSYSPKCGVAPQAGGYLAPGGVARAQGNRSKRRSKATFGTPPP